MTKYFNNRTLSLALALSTTMFASQALSQDFVLVPATAGVQNAITLTVDQAMTFGTIYAIADATNDASINLSTASVQTYTNDAPAVAGLVSGVPAAAQVTVDGVTGATINLTIRNVVDPFLLTDVLDLNTFRISINGAAEAGATVNTPIPYTALATDTILIGASLTTPLQASIEDGAYEGSFELVASY